MKPERSRAKPATILDVASEAGVSRQTVTRAMNNMSGINPATKQRVLAVARALKYRPSRFARGLVVAHPLTMGLLLDDMTNPFYSELAASVVSSAAELGWNVIFADTAHGLAGPRPILDSLAMQVDAAIGYVHVGSDELDEVFGDMPVVVLEKSPEPGDRSVITFDFEPGLLAGIAHLDDAGRRHIAMLDAGSVDEPSERGRQFERIMLERGLEPIRLPGGPTIADGVDAMRRLLDTRPEVDAVIAFNDLVAMGAMKELHRVGVDIPGRCAVLGIDGLSIGEIVTPELSSLALDLRAVGRLAVELAVGMYTGELPMTGPEVQRTVSHTLLLRATA
ncbi:LacI family DNA-binding transcriptional regulator [Lacisediminihabitans sp.]|jgi:DNA-binding LacI/PurR family transcriptional regulator|uniref:LacI family DNA-binding transcriptional regulator n=1 Tax=Lacisediminihabitans sp. TaxID=2787631 RepID=UPI002F950B31